MTMPSPIRILLVDDQPTVRQGLRLRLATEQDIEIAGEAGDGQLALELAATLTPDVVVLDIAMPGMDGIATARQLRMATNAAIVMLSMQDDATSRSRAIAAGADVFVAKHEAGTRLINVIRRVADDTRGDRHVDGGP